MRRKKRRTEEEEVFDVHDGNGREGRSVLFFSSFSFTYKEGNTTRDKHARRALCVRVSVCVCRWSLSCSFKQLFVYIHLLYRENLPYRGKGKG